MAVSWIISAESVRTGTEDPYTFSVTVDASARGLAVGIAHGGGGGEGDLVDAVSIGGVALTRVNTISDAAGEPGRSYLYFVGSGLPASGSQTVSVGFTSAVGNDVHIVVMQLAGSADLEVVDSDTTSGDLTNVTLTLNYGGRTCISVAAEYFGGPSVPAGTLASGCSVVQNHDHIAFVSEMIRQSTPGTSDFTIGYSTQGPDDVAFCAMAISEVVAAAASLPFKRRSALFEPDDSAGWGP